MGYERGCYKRVYDERATYERVCDAKGCVLREDRVSHLFLATVR